MSELPQDIWARTTGTGVNLWIDHEDLHPSTQYTDKANADAEKQSLAMSAEFMIKDQRKRITKLEGALKAVPFMINKSMGSNYDQRQYVCGHDALEINRMCEQTLEEK